MKRLHPVIALVLLTLSTYYSGISQLPKGADHPVRSTSKEAIQAFYQGLVLTDWNEHKKAKPYFLKAIQHDSTLASGYMYLGLVDFSPTAFADGLKKAKVHLSTASEWDQIFFQTLKCFLTGDMKKRLEIEKKKVARFPNYARSYLNLGYAYESLDDPKNARLNFQKAVALAPNFFVGYEQLANSYLYTEPKDPMLAEKLARKALSFASVYPGPHLLLGDCLRAQNKLADAKAAYSEAIHIDSQHAKGYYKRGDVNTLLGHYEQGRKDYEKGGTLDELPTEAELKIACSYLYQNDRQKALDILLAATKKASVISDSSKANQARFEILNAAHLVAFHKGDFQLLQKITQELLLTSEQYVEEFGTKEANAMGQTFILFLNGLTAILKGEYNNGMASADTLKKVMVSINDPVMQSFFSNTLLGHVAYRQGNYQKAVEHFNQPGLVNNVYSKYWRAKSYEEMGEKEKSRQLYQEILANNIVDLDNALVHAEVKQKVKLL